MTKGEEATFEVRPATGGLQSKFRAPMVAPTQSPDLANVLFHQHSVLRRNGCVPVNRTLPGKNSIRNRGHGFVAQQSATPFTNRTFKVVAGHGFVGHRPHLNAYQYINDGVLTTTLTVSFIVSPEPDGDEVSESSNWFSYNETAAGTAAETYVYRPILSKGPMRGTRYANGERLAWSIFVINVGGLPAWGAYVQQSGVAAPVLIVSSTAKSATTCPPRPHHTYRVTLGISATSAGGNARLVVCEQNGDGTTTTEAITQPLDTNPWTNSGPILFFDAPQAMFEATNAEGGLQLTDGYLLDVMRFEGKLQDVGIWRVDKSLDTAFTSSFLPNVAPSIGPVPASEAGECSAPGGVVVSVPVAVANPSLGNPSRLVTVPLPPVRPQPAPIPPIIVPVPPVAPSPWNPSPGSPDSVDLIAHWLPETMTEKRLGEAAEDRWLIPESYGRDLPIVWCPSVPIWNKANGKTSLYFNGRSSYAFMQTAVGQGFASPPTGGTNNRNYVGFGAGALQVSSYEQMVRNGAGSPRVVMHSIAVTFVPDSIEPRGDNGTSGTHAEAQGLVFWWGVVKFGITTRGAIYCAPMDGAAFMATTLFGAVSLIPGQRYTLVYQRRSATLARVYLNGESLGDITPAAAPAGIALGLPMMILGVEDTISAGVSSSKEYPRATHGSLHFTGRIEDVRIAGGILDPATGWQRDLEDEDLYLESSRVWWLNDNAGPPFITEGLRAPLGVDGYFLRPEGATQAVIQHPPFYSHVLARPIGIDLANSLVQMTLLGPADSLPDGFDDNRSVSARITQYLSWWNFATSSLDVNYQSRHAVSREFALPGRRFYQQQYAAADRLNAALPLTLVSREPDTDQRAPGDIERYPWGQVAPTELAPRIAAGLVSARPETNPVTLIAPYKLDSGARPTVVAAAASLYWLQPPWMRAGNGILATAPYSKTADPTQTCFFGSGRLRNHIEIPASTAWDMSTAGMTIEFWIRVPELGVQREVALNWDGLASNAFNWRITLTQEGGLGISGYRSGPLFWNVATIYATGGVNGTPITPGRWHHVAFCLHCDAAGTDLIADDQIYVDGEATALEMPVGNHATGWTGGAGRKWIVGHAHHLGPARAIGTEGLMLEPLLGWLRDFRVTAGVRYTTNFIPPQFPLPIETATITLLPLNDGADAVANASGGTTLLHGAVRCEEMLPIADGLLLTSNSTERYPYDWGVYHNVLYATNGLGPPLSHRFRGLRGPRAISRDGRKISQPFGFATGRMGITPPGKDQPSLEGGTAGAGFAGNVAYNVGVTFVSADGLESDPITYTLTPVGGAGPFTYLELRGLPRSLEPHVVARRIYIGQFEPLFYVKEGKTDDNLTDEVEITNDFATVALQFTNGAPPVSRFLAIHRGRSYMTESNTSTLSFSEAGLIESHSASATAIDKLSLESGAGNPLAWVKEHLGRLYAGKRDSIFNVVPGIDVPNFTLYRLNTSKGFVGGHTVVSFDNHLFGAMEKGVHTFEGAGIDYVGEDLEGYWENLDLTPESLVNWHGAYLESLNQYWLAVRRTGERFGSEIVVFDGVAQDPATGRHPWSFLSTVKHSYLEVVEDPVTDHPILYLGTPEGQVMQYLVGQTDGSRCVANPGFAGSSVPFVLAGTATAGSTQTLEISATNATVYGLIFDTLGSGLRGLWCYVYRASDGSLHRVRILKNTATLLTFETQLSFAVGAGDQFEIGGYHAYWSSAWLPMSSAYQVKMVRSVDVDFAPNAGIELNLRVLQGTRGTGSGVVLADAFDFGGVPDRLRKTVDMTLGYHRETKDMEARCLYWRLYFGTIGRAKPFEVFGFSAAFSEEGGRKGRV